MTEYGLKDAIRRSVDRIRDSFVRTRIPVAKEDFAGSMLVSVLGEIEF